MKDTSIFKTKILKLDISATQKLILIFLSQFLLNGFIGTKKTIAENIGTSESTIKRDLKELQKRNYIFYVYKKNDYRHININFVKLNKDLEKIKDTS